ncbi:MAG: amidohydrolase family protein [Spirochaetales bacterium]|nr:amidohydrolase family protein [Spirochaetales bacterium]
MIIDFHTHAFPDHIAERAIAALEAGCNVKTRHKGTISSLLASMDDAGIDISVICSIATKPLQFDPILAWSKQITSKRIIPFPSLHPADPDPAEKVKIIHEEGFKGIKLHPYYQEFSIDEERMFPVYEACERHRLLLVCHTGFDIAFPRDRIADPEKIEYIASRFPGLLFVSTHLGGWYDWDEVEKHLTGKPRYMEISFSLEELPGTRAKELITRHPPGYLLFGTDSPWTDQTRAVKLLKALHLEPETEENIFYRNAAQLLGLEQELPV